MSLIRARCQRSRELGRGIRRKKMMLDDASARAAGLQLGHRPRARHAQQSKE